jgi:multidrug efflux pump subunit AcrB
MAALLFIGGALSMQQMAKDIFPAIDIPVVGIIWTYNGLPAQEMAERITIVSERASTTTVNNIEPIESNSFKNGDASTLDVVSRVRKALPQIAATLPEELQIKQLFDQSVFVSSALDGVLREGLIAASLTAVMILLFLGSWRSTLESLKGKRCCRQVKFYSGVSRLTSPWSCLSRILRAGPRPWSY